MCSNNGYYEAPEHGWTCFHCGETFKTVGAAEDHFGKIIDTMPGCVLKLTGGDFGLLMHLRRLEFALYDLVRYIELMQELGSDMSIHKLDFERLWDRKNSAVNVLTACSLNAKYFIKREETVREPGVMRSG